MEINKLFSQAQVKSEDGKLIVAGWASTDTLDRHGDVILASAWKGGIKNFKRNPVILYNHDHSHVIGKATATRVEKDKGLYIEAEIDDQWEKAYQVEKGYLSTFSVGFKIAKGGYEYDEDEDKFTIKKAELLEVSIVTVPANPDAVFNRKALLKDHKSKKPIMLEKIAKFLGLETTSEDEVFEAVKALKQNSFEDYLEKNENGDVQIKGLEGITKAVEEVSDTLESQITEVSEEAKGLRQENEDLETQVTDLEDQVKELRLDIADLVEKYGKIKSKKNSGEPNDGESNTVKRFRENVRKFTAKTKIDL